VIGTAAGEGFAKDGGEDECRLRFPAEFLPPQVLMPALLLEGLASDERESQSATASLAFRTTDDGLPIDPLQIFRATMAMNAAQAYHVAELYALPELMLPFDVNEYAVVGTHLAHMVFDGPDQGHRSDMAGTNAWAAEVNLVGWIGWQSPATARCLGVELGTR